MLFKVDTLYGHVVEETDDGLVYQDDGSPVTAETVRPCKGCGACIKNGEQDPCIANLPGTHAACCGHGCETTVTGKSNPGYVALEDGRTFRFSGTVGGERIRQVVEAVLAGEALPEGFEMDEEKMWWHGLTDAQRAYVYANIKQSIFDLVRELTDGQFPPDDYLTTDNMWYEGVDEDARNRVMAAMGPLMDRLAEAARENA